MKYIVYLFYRYYNKGATIRIPYESAMIAILLLLLINMLSLMLLLIPDTTKILVGNHTKAESYLYSAIIVAIGYFLLSKLVPKNELLQFKSIPKNVKLHGWILCLYVISSVIFLMFMIIVTGKPHI
jgi:hypothetical protein